MKRVIARAENSTHFAMITREELSRALYLAGVSVTNITVTAIHDNKFSFAIEDINWGQIVTLLQELEKWLLKSIEECSAHESEFCHEFWNLMRGLIPTYTVGFRKPKSKNQVRSHIYTLEQMVAKQKMHVELVRSAHYEG